MRVKCHCARIPALFEHERPDAGVVERAAAVRGAVVFGGLDLAAFGGREARAGLRRVHVLAAQDGLHGGAPLDFQREWRL